MYLSSSGGGSAGPRPSSDLKDDGCPGDRGNEVLLSDVDLSRVGAESKIRSYYPPSVSQGLLIPPEPAKLAALPVVLRVCGWGEFHFQGQGQYKDIQSDTEVPQGDSASNWGSL